MKADRAALVRRKRLAFVGAAGVWLSAAGALAQDDAPSAALPDAEATAGDDDLADDGQGAAAPPSTLRWPLTPAQELVASLPPPRLPGDPDAPPDADGPKPREALRPDTPMPSPDPRNLEGAWTRDTPLGRSLHRIETDMYGAPVPYTMAGARVLQRRILSNQEGKPFANASAMCRPPGAPWQHDIAFPFRVFQTENYVEFIFEEYHGRWYIQLNPELAPPPAERAYVGHSVGHWDGNTLVVETTGHKQGLWLDFDGTPFSREGKLIARIRKIDHGDRKPYLEMTTTMVDPAYYTDPWSVVRRFGWNPASFSEYNCEEQLGDPSAQADAGLIPEPQD